MQVIDKMVIIQPNISFWSGTKKLDPEDIGYNPPQDLVNLGNKKVVPQWSLRKFETLKKKVDRTLSRYGIRLLGGFAVSEDVVSEVQDYMKQMEDEFMQARDEFLSAFWNLVQEQADNYPDWKFVIYKSASLVYPELFGKFKFGYRAYKIRPPQEEQEAEINNEFVSDSEVEEQALSEISEEASEMLKNLAGQSNVRRDSLYRLSKLRGKIKSLLPVDREFLGQTVEMIDRVLGEMPEKGFLSEEQKKLACALVLALYKVSDPDTRGKILNGQYQDMDTLSRDQIRSDSDETPETEGSEAESGTGSEAEAETDSEEEFVWF